MQPRAAYREPAGIYPCRCRVAVRPGVAPRHVCRSDAAKLTHYVYRVTRFSSPDISYPLGWEAEQPLRSQIVGVRARNHPRSTIWIDAQMVGSGWANPATSREVAVLGAHFRRATEKCGLSDRIDTPFLRPASPKCLRRARPLRRSSVWVALQRFTSSTI